MKKIFISAMLILVVFFSLSLQVDASEKTDALVDKCTNEWQSEFVNLGGLWIWELPKVIESWSNQNIQINNCILSDDTVEIDDEAYMACFDNSIDEINTCIQNAYSFGIGGFNSFTNCYQQVNPLMKKCASKNEIGNENQDTNQNNNSSNSTNDHRPYEVVSCGGGIELPSDLVNLISIVITALQVAVPIILVVMGMLDFAKATAASKEEDIKKGQQTFVRRLIAGACVFFVIFVVKVTIGALNTDDSNQLLACVDKLLNGTSGLSKEEQFEIQQESLKSECEELYATGGNWKKCICEVALDVYSAKGDIFEGVAEEDIPEYIKNNSEFRDVFDSYATEEKSKYGYSNCESIN